MYAPTNVAATSGTWTVDVSPPNADSKLSSDPVARVTFRAGNGPYQALTGAGYAAMLAVFSAYQTATVIGTVKADLGSFAGPRGCQLTVQTGWIDCLRADVATVSASIEGVLATAANTANS
jgi:hypothetical protein